MNYQSCYEEGRRILAGAQIEESDLDARLLLEYVCQTTRNDLLAHGDREVEAGQERRYRELIAGRAKHIPLQHLTGVQEFMGLEFCVNRHVLIPRQDTEILAEEVLKDLHDGMQVLDLCTGSGCILISLLHYSNRCRGVGSDLSEEALAVAVENSRRLLDNRTQGGDGCKVEFLQSDLFERIEGKFDRIVSNPPYIRTSVLETLMPEVRDYEPVRALDGGKDGLYFYRRIAEESPRYLVRGGRLYLETGYDQAQEVCALLRMAGFVETEVAKDYSGLDRVVSGTFLE